MDFKGKPTSTAHGALARLWRNIIKDNKLEHALGFLVTRYITKNTSDSKNIRRKTRSTLESDITAKEMTWKKFTHLVFHYLGAVRLDITIKLTFANGRSTVHTVGIKSSENEDNKDLEEASKE
ncbi:MAG: hypothetical protein Q9M11_03605 [Mariprofundaceae bacterium]|nr:hypothetical protein [Mariprofundaceae bacterium]